MSACLRSLIGVVAVALVTLPGILARGDGGGFGRLGGYHGGNGYGGGSSGYTYRQTQAVAQYPSAGSAVAPETTGEEPTDFYAEAMAAFRAGRYADSARLARSAAASRPSDPDVHLLLTLGSFAVGQYDRAAKEAQCRRVAGPNTRLAKALCDLRQRGHLHLPAPGVGTIRGQVADGGRGPIPVGFPVCDARPPRGGPAAISGGAEPRAARPRGGRTADQPRGRRAAPDSGVAAGIEAGDGVRGISRGLPRARSDGGGSRVCPCSVPTACRAGRAFLLLVLGG